MEYAEILLHRGIVTPKGEDIQLLPEFVYKLGGFRVKYNIGIEFNPTPNNTIFKADVNSWNTGIGSNPPIGKMGEAYFPDGLNPNTLGIILVKNITSNIQEKTFKKNQDLITCLLEHHKYF